MRFILLHQPHLRPSWMICSGLFLYDHLGKAGAAAGQPFPAFAPNTSPLQEAITKGYEYLDCWVDDARLVVLNAKRSAAIWVVIFTRTRCLRVTQKTASGRCWCRTN